MSNKRRSYRVLLGIIVIAVALRVAAAFFLGNEVVNLPGTFDQISYHNLALRVLDGHGFSFGETWWPATRPNEPTAHWSFLYTLYLSTVYLATGANPLVARLIQAVVVGILMPLLVYRLALSLFSAKPSTSEEPEFEKGEIIGLLAAGISAVYIYFVYYAATLMTESFYFICILWSLWLVVEIGRSPSASWGQWLTLGLALGLTILLRQVFLLVVPFLLAWLWVAARPRVTRLFGVLAVLLLMILPWTIRNYAAFDHFVLLNTNSGFAFYWGNHPIYGTRFESILPAEMGTYQSLLPAELLYLNEAELDSAVLELAIENIQEDPVRYVLLSLSRIPPYIKFWPSADSSTISNISRVASFGLFLPFMAFGFLSSLRYRYSSLGERLRSPFTLIFLFMAVYAGVHILTWTLIRYRLPLDALLILFAGLAFFKLGEWLRSIRGFPATVPGTDSRS